MAMMYAITSLMGYEIKSATFCRNTCSFAETILENIALAGQRNAGRNRRGSENGGMRMSSSRGCRRV